MPNQVFVGVGPGRYINFAQIVWIDFESNPKSITLYLSAPGPDGKSSVKITDPKFLHAVANMMQLEPSL